MTQEQKEYLLKDLVQRLPYGVKFMIDKTYLTEDMIKGGYDKTQELYGITREGNVELLNMDYHMPIESIKPYLFPLSSMTDELWDKEFMGYGITEFTRDSFKYGCETLEFNNSNPNLLSMVRFINQLIKNHFDIYGLIPMGLAIDATGLNIY